MWIVCSCQGEKMSKCQDQLSINAVNILDFKWIFLRKIFQSSFYLPNACSIKEKVSFNQLLKSEKRSWQCLQNHLLIRNPGIFQKRRLNYIWRRCTCFCIMFYGIFSFCHGEEISSYGTHGDRYILANAVEPSVITKKVFFNFENNI